MEILIALGVAGAAGALIAWAVKDARKREQAWRAVAARRGARFRPSSGFLRSKPYAIEERYGDIDMLLDTYVVSTGKSSQTYTRCRAQFVFPAGPRFKVYRQGFFSSLGKALGMQDVVLGRNAEFDQHFVVKTDSDALTRAVLSEQTMQRLLRVLPHARVESNGHEVKLTYTGALSEPPHLEACLDVIGEVANSDIFGLGALRGVPGAEILSQTTVRVEVPDSVELGIGVDRSRVRTWARADIARDAPSFRTDVSPEGRFSDEIPTGAIPQSANKYLEELAGGRVESESGKVMYWFDRIETNLQRLMAGARLAASIGRGPARGVFR